MLALANRTTTNNIDTRGIAAFVIKLVTAPKQNGKIAGLLWSVAVGLLEVREQIAVAKDVLRIHCVLDRSQHLQARLGDGLHDPCLADLAHCWNTMSHRCKDVRVNKPPWWWEMLPPLATTSSLAADSTLWKVCRGSFKSFNGYSELKTIGDMCDTNIWHEAEVEVETGTTIIRLGHTTRSLWSEIKSRKPEVWTR